MSFEDKLKRISNIVLGVLASAWMIAQLFFTFVKPIHPMTLSPIFLCFALAIIFLPNVFMMIPLDFLCLCVTFGAVAIIPIVMTILSGQLHRFHRLRDFITKASKKPSSSDEIN